MSDDERRRLERDARYDAGLAALLVCLREGHAPPEREGVRHEYGDGRVTIELCPRCHLCHWRHEAAPTETDDERRRRVRRSEREALEAERQRVIDENVRNGGGAYRPF